MYGIGDLICILMFVEVGVFVSVLIVDVRMLFFVFFYMLYVLGILLVLRCFL